MMRDFLAGVIAFLVGATAGTILFVGYVAAQMQTQIVWDVPASQHYQGPGDITAFTAWYGMRAYSAAVAATGTQPALDLRRVDNNATCTALIGRDGKLDLTVGTPCPTSFPTCAAGTSAGFTTANFVCAEQGSGGTGGNPAGGLASNSVGGAITSNGGVGGVGGATCGGGGGGAGGPDGAGVAGHNGAGVCGTSSAGNGSAANNSVGTGTGGVASTAGTAGSGGTDTTKGGGGGGGTSTGTSGSGGPPGGGGGGNWTSGSGHAGADGEVRITGSTCATVNFTTPGAFTWTADCTGTVTWNAWGPGGSGAGSGSSAAPGGGAGAFASGSISVTSGVVYNGIIGTGGAGSAGAGNSGSGPTYIGPTGSGGQTVTAWIGGSTARVSKMYDQVAGNACGGASCDVVQATAAAACASVDWLRRRKHTPLS